MEVTGLSLEALNTLLALSIVTLYDCEIRSGAESEVEVCDRRGRYVAFEKVSKKKRPDPLSFEEALGHLPPEMVRRITFLLPKPHDEEVHNREETQDEETVTDVGGQDPPHHAKGVSLTT